MKFRHKSYIMILSLKEVMNMNSLQKKILTDGTVLPGNILKVDSFLNHQIDIGLLKDMGKDFYELFKSKNITN